MARHCGLQPTGELSSSATGPGADHHRGDGNGAEARDQGDFLLYVFRDVDLAPAFQGSRPARPFTGS
eukprot:7791059-Alexandrium_andersonii.AAC.1